MYGRAGSKILAELEVIQKSILKIIFKKDRRYSSDLIFKNLNVCNITNLFIKNISFYIYKNEEQIIKYKEQNYNLRNKSVVIRKCRTTKGQKSIEYIGPKIYLQIPEEFRTENNFKTFKQKIKNWLKESDRKITYE
ncbi:hypothetical protein WDU94_005518 [Cyamophila willieti]